MKPFDPTDFTPTDKIMEFPSEIIGLKTVGDRLVVNCIDGVSHIVSKERFEILNVPGDK